MGSRRCSPRSSSARSVASCRFAIAVVSGDALLVTNFSKELRGLLFGNPFGEIYPPRQNPPPPIVDGRTHALRVLKRYFQELQFNRSGGTDENGVVRPPITFTLPERDIHIEWPDNPEDVHLPAIALLAEDRGQYEAIGMTSYVDEESRNKYGDDTIIIWMSEYQETFVVELWAQTKAQRRAILAGLEVAFSPLQQMAGIRFRMPEYFDQLVCFELQNKEIVEDDLAVRNRRRARLRVLMRFNVVALVNATDFAPVVTVDESGPDQEGDGG
jgi:hypothetical protein